MVDNKWSAILDECISKVGEKWPAPPALEKPIPGGKADGSSTITGILYSGNIHETVPKQLFLDNRLTPVERNGWQVFKLLLDKQGFAAPRYEDLQPYLSMTPYAEKASKETVAKVIHILRLTRWLSLINKGRDKHTGQLLGSIYILHDEPITPAEALQLDSNYLNFVVNCCKHANKNVSIVAKGAFDDLHESDNQSVQTRLSLLAQRIQKQISNEPDKLNEHAKPKQNNHLVRNSIDPSSESEPSKNSLVRNRFSPSSESEPSLHPPISNLVRNPNPYSTSTVYIHNSTSTVLDHPRLKDLTKQQQSKLAALVNELDTDLINQVFDEFNKRCNDTINNPIGYLFGLLKKAKNNEFKPWLSSSNTSIHHNQPNASTKPPSRTYCRDTTKPIPNEVKQQMADLKKLFSTNKT